MSGVPKFFRLQLFRNWRIIGAINLVFWPIVGGLTIMKLILPKEDERPVSGVESERIRKMLDDVYKKSAEQKIEDAIKTLGLFMDPSKVNPAAVVPASGLPADGKDQK